MKKQFVFALLCSSFLIACDKEEDTPPTTAADATAPVMTLNGNAKDTVVLNSTYADAGATAIDNVDGTISSNVVVTGNLNMNQAGDYTRKYNVMDAAGNAATELTRNIHVRNEAWFLPGAYAAVPNCGSTPASNYNTNISVSATQNKAFTFSSLQSNFTGLSPIGTLQTNTTFSIAPLNGNGAGFSGSGQILQNGNVILSSYIQQPGVIGGYFCTSTLTPQ
jgi:hypothetical protein